MWRVNRMTEVYVHTSDPAHPVKIRDFGLPGQQPGATGAVPEQLHGMISLGVQNSRIYFGYGTNKAGVMQIVDRDKLLNGPKEPTPENLLYPEVGRLVMTPFNGAHTAFPMPRMPIPEFAKNSVSMRSAILAWSYDEQIRNECEEPQQNGVVRRRDDRSASDGHFQFPGCRLSKWRFLLAAGAVSATHSSNESMAPVFYKKIAFLAYFNAGVRAVDIFGILTVRRTPGILFASPLRSDQTKRCIKLNGQDRCKVAIQTNNVETDDRGYIYIVDRANTGMHILELTGEARATAGLQ